jgi:hypothetical protein
MAKLGRPGSFAYLDEPQCITYPDVSLEQAIEERARFQHQFFAPKPEEEPVTALQRYMVTLKHQAK